MRTTPLVKTPIIPDNHLLEITAKIIPTSEREPKIIIINGKSVFGPLRIKNIKTLLNTIRIERTPYLFIPRPSSFFSTNEKDAPKFLNFLDTLFLMKR